MCQFNITTPIRYHPKSRVRRGCILAWLSLLWLALLPFAHAQLPNIFVADDPSGSLVLAGLT